MTGKQGQEARRPYLIGLTGNIATGKSESEARIRVENNDGRNAELVIQSQENADWVFRLER